MKGFSVGLRLQIDAIDQEDMIRQLTDLFGNKRADNIADWEIDWHATEETEPNWED